MNQLMKWTFIFVTLMMLMNNSPAFTIGNKNLMSAASIHSTYFFTPNNSAFVVHAKANLGLLNNGVCNTQSQTYDLGQAELKTGDRLYWDAYKLQSLVGGRYSCMMVTYYSDISQQPVREMIQLVWNGVIYSLALPALSQVTIL